MSYVFLHPLHNLKEKTFSPLRSEIKMLQTEKFEIRFQLLH